MISHFENSWGSKRGAEERIATTLKKLKKVRHSLSTPSLHDSLKNKKQKIGTSASTPHLLAPRRTAKAKPFPKAAYRPRDRPWADASKDEVEIVREKGVKQRPRRQKKKKKTNRRTAWSSIHEPLRQNLNISKPQRKSIASKETPTSPSSSFEYRDVVSTSSYDKWRCRFKGKQSVPVPPAVLDDKYFFRLDQGTIVDQLARDDQTDGLKSPPAPRVPQPLTGRSPYWSGGILQHWRWRRCEVLEFDTKTKQYRIQFRHDGSCKWVKRANLLLNDESQTLFKREVRKMNAERELAKSCIRFDQFFKKLKSGGGSFGSDNANVDLDVEPLSEVALRNMYWRSLSFLKRNESLDEAMTCVANLVNEIDESYSDAIRMSILRLRVKTSERVRSAYEELKLPRFPESKPAPSTGRQIVWDAYEYGMHVVRQHPEFSARKTSFKNVHSSKSIPLSNLVSFLRCAHWTVLSRADVLRDIESAVKPGELASFKVDTRAFQDAQQEIMLRSGEMRSYYVSLMETLPKDTTICTHLQARMKTRPYQGF